MSSGTARVDRQKSAWRTELQRRRSTAHSLRHAIAASALSDRFFAQFGDVLTGMAVAGYWPMRDEIDIRPVLHGLAECGAVVALPVVTGRAEPLDFRRWSPGDRLIKAAFGVSEPDAASPCVVPDMAIVPLLGFDARGSRLGYGGGFYDRTLPALRRSPEFLAVGVAYDEQECDKIPVDATDATLDMILTDRRTILPGEKGSTD